MEPLSKHSKKLADNNVPKDILEDVQSVEFEYPDEGEVFTAHKQEIEEKLRAFLMNFISLDPFDFIIFQQRVLYHRNAREIGRFPLLPGRMAVKARCEDLAQKFPIFKGALLAGFDKPDEEEEPCPKNTKTKTKE